LAIIETLTAPKKLRFCVFIYCLQSRDLIETHI
jgi:hypothetical protein